MTDRENQQKEDYSEDRTVDAGVIIVDFQKSDALVGQRLEGRFLIVKDLTESGADSGGIGLVYLAKDLKLMSREVVVKILKQASLKNKDIARKFQHEKEALIRLEHPNIVRILDSGTLSDGNPFMVMEYIEGYSLRRVLRQNGKLPFDFVAHITESITDALSAAHFKKVLHRDIKPANIMLTPREEGFDRVRLIDFGIARVEDSQLADATKTRRSMGTLLYIAPEQLWGDLEQTPAIDIYAFAIVVYEMLTGALPFMPHSEADMFELQRKGVETLPVELRGDLPAEAERILLSALEFEAKKRPQNARAFGRDLANALRKNVNYTTNKEIQAPDLPKTAPPNSKNEETFTLAPTEPSTGKQETDFPNINFPKQQKRKSSKRLMWSLIGLLVLAAVSIPVGMAIWKNAGKNSTANTANSNTVEKTNGNILPQKELTYFLKVQKMRDGKPFETPFKSSGQEIFETDYQFKMVFQSDADGFIYLFNEGKDAQGKIIYSLLYPTPKTNNGSAKIKAKQQIETSQNTFTGARGTEIVWVLWSTRLNSDLDAVKQDALDRPEGIVTDTAAKQKLNDFIQTYGEKQPEAVKDTANMRTAIKTADDAFAYKMQLEHR